MNRTGLLTFHRTTNFGSLLQTYALYQKIKDLGYDCSIIDYRCPAIEKRENLNTRLFSGSIKIVLRNLLFLPLYKRKEKSFSEFINKYLVLSKPFYPQTIKDATKEYDKIIVGSDIVWGRDITEDDYTYFLDFTDHSVSKYAFASSVGNYRKRGDEQKVEKLLKQFKRISVREKEAIDWLEELGIKNAEWVCDPTMLLSSDDWKKFIPLQKTEKKYVLVYFLDDNKKILADAKRYAAIHGCTVYLINYDRPFLHVHNTAPKSIEEFLSLIYHAQMVFTASYHGMLFSLYFEKEMLFYTRAHKTRVISLAKRLGILDHCGDDIDHEQYVPLDYNRINEKINSFRDESTNVLLSFLKN